MAYESYDSWATRTGFGIPGAVEAIYSSFDDEYKKQKIEEWRDEAFEFSSVIK